MHHSESAGDSPGTKKIAHASVISSRRGSNTGSGGTSASLNAVSMNCNAIPNDEHQSSLLIHHTPPAGSSSPSPHHPSASVIAHTQSQSHQSAGAQIKKKSGFQITSVLPAQVNASTNNSIADDTESYDDLDESHTEDLSSSDILDASMSRATDTGIPERSSSEETLNSLHGGETPAVISPNESVNPHLHSVQPGYLTNGTVHHHNHHPPGQHQDQGMTSVATPQQSFQREPVCSASLTSNAPSAGTTVQSVAGLQSRAQRAISVQAAVVDVSATGNGNQTLLLASSSTAGASGAGIPGSVIGSSAIGGGLLCATVSAGSITTCNTVTAVQLPPVSSTTQVQASTAIASRFRVVKLDSSSEPFRKGRWMCTEYYEKEAPAAAPFPDAAPAYRAVESFILSESESTSGGSSCSTMSGAGDPGILTTQQTFVQPAVPVIQPNLFQTPPLNTHSQDTGMHTLASPPVLPPNNPQIVSIPSILGTEGQPSPLRAQQQIPYIAEGHTGQLQSGYPINQQPSMPMNQGLQSVDYAQTSQGIQAQAPSHQMLPVQNSITRATPGASLPVATPTVAVPQCVSPRPQVPVAQMVLAQGSTINPVQQHQLQISPEQQQQATANQPPASLTTGQSAPSKPSSLQSNVQLGIPPSLPHGSPVGGDSGGLGLMLHHQGGQSSQLPLARGPYSGVTPLTASQLEDAGRLLFQHQSLLSLPRLAAGTVLGFGGQYGSEASTNFGQEDSASGDASGLATSARIDEDR